MSEPKHMDTDKIRSLIDQLNARVIGVDRIPDTLCREAAAVLARLNEPIAEPRGCPTPGACSCILPTQPDDIAALCERLLADKREYQGRADFLEPVYHERSANTLEREAATALRAQQREIDTRDRTIKAMSGEQQRLTKERDEALSFIVASKSDGKPASVVHDWMLLVKREKARATAAEAERDKWQSLYKAAKLNAVFGDGETFEQVVAERDKAIAERDEMHRRTYGSPEAGHLIDEAAKLLGPRMEQLQAAERRIGELESALRKIEQGHDETQSFSGTMCSEIARSILKGTDQ